MWRVTSSGRVTTSSDCRELPTKKRGIRLFLIDSGQVASKRPAVTVEVFDLRETVSPELILRLAQRFRAGLYCPRINRVDIVDIQIKRLRRDGLRAFRRACRRTECTLRREHDDQLIVI